MTSNLFNLWKNKKQIAKRLGDPKVLVREDMRDWTSVMTPPDELVPHTASCNFCWEGWFPIKKNIVFLNNCVFREAHYNLEHNEIFIANMWAITFQNKRKAISITKQRFQSPSETTQCPKVTTDLLHLFLNFIWIEFHSMFFGLHFFNSMTLGSPTYSLFLSPKCLCPCSFCSLSEFCLLSPNSFSHNTWLITLLTSLNWYNPYPLVVFPFKTQWNL